MALDLADRLDGRAVDGSDSLSRAISRKRPGDPLQVTIYRGGRTTKVTVKLGEGATPL